MLKLKQKSKFFSANLTYFILIIGFIVIRLLSSLNALEFLGNYGTYVLNLVLQVGLMFLLPLFLYSFLTREKPKNVMQNFGLRKIKFSAIGIAVAIGIIVYVLNIGVSSFFATILSLFGYEKLSSTTITSYSVGELIINLIFTGLLPAFCEEFTHRGMLVDGYSKLGYKKAIFFSALLFGLTHLNIEQFFYATIIGVLLAFITMITGNIFPAMIIHFMNNAINVFVSFAVVNFKSFANFYNSIFDAMSKNNFLVVISALFFIISTLILVLIFLVYMLFKKTTVAELNALAEKETKKQLRAELMDEYPQEVKPDVNSIPFQVFNANRTINIYISSQTLRHPIKQVYFPSLREKTFFIASLVTAIFVTIATFIWGIL